MKKALLALTLFLTVAFAHAVSFTTEYGYFDSKNKADTNSITVYPTFEALGLTIDLRFRGAVNNAGVDSQGVELRARKDFSVAKDLKFYVRAGVNEAYTPTSSITQYSIEPGLNYTVNNAWSLNTSYKFADAINSTNKAQKTNAAYVGAKYSITKQDAFSLRLYKQYGDSLGNGAIFGYTRSF